MRVVLSKEIAASENVLSSNNVRAKKNAGKRVRDGAKANSIVTKVHHGHTRLKSRKGLLFFVCFEDINICYLITCRTFHISNFFLF